MRYRLICCHFVKEAVQFSANHASIIIYLPSKFVEYLKTQVSAKQNELSNTSYTIQYISNNRTIYMHISRINKIKHT